MLLSIIKQFHKSKFYSNKKSKEFPQRKSRSHSDSLTIFTRTQKYTKSINTFSSHHIIQYIYINLCFAIKLDLKIC